MHKYNKAEIEKLYEKRKHITVGALPLDELIDLLEKGWVIYDTQITSDENIKFLTLARVNQPEE